MDMGMIVENTEVLKQTTKYLNGEVKQVVEKRIITNLAIIDEFFDGLNEEYQSIQSYENQ
tara:strand:- start:574 stop:753 length:180 start_codon:yes stop_codon:yes gene_type:complete